jgi:hypothetical protein
VTIWSGSGLSLLQNIYLYSSPSCIHIGRFPLEVQTDSGSTPSQALQLGSANFPTQFNLKSMFRNASYYATDDLFDVPVTNLNPNLLITVDEQNSYLTAKPGVDNTFTSHFNVKLNTNYIESTFMMYDICKNQVSPPSSSGTTNI